MEQGKLVPKRRFEEFEGSWQKKKLKDFRDENDGYSFTGGPFGSDLKSEDYTTSGVRIIQLQNIGDGYFSNKYKIYTSEKKAKSLSTNLIYPNDIIIAKMAEPLARAAIIPDIDSKYLMASDGIRLKVDTEKFHTYFLLTLINSDIFRKKALENSTGTTRKRIGLVTLGSIASNIPQLEEQQKIGEFFKHLDEMIALQQKKIDKTKALKSAYLAEMFPAEGERVPKRRFAGFTDDWEEKQLGEVGHTFNGLSGKTKKDFGHGSAEFVTYLNVFNNPISKTSMTENVEVDSKQSEVKYGDVLFTTSSETPHEVGMSSVWLDNRPNVYLNSFCFGYRMNVDVNHLFTAYLFRSKNIREQMKVLAQGISRYNISKTKVMEMNLLLPSQEEQEKIGEFFKGLDDIISNHQQKLEKLQATKQAYLNEMFV